MAIYRLLQSSAFDPEHVELLVKAYEKSLVRLRLRNRADPITFIIARKIIEVAQTGQRDSDTICAVALAELGIASEGRDLSIPAKSIEAKPLLEPKHESKEGVSLLPLASFLAWMPCGAGVMDLEGRWIVANAQMRRIVPNTIPSRDKTAIRKWRAFDVEGRQLESTNSAGRESATRRNRRCETSIFWRRWARGIDACLCHSAGNRRGADRRHRAGE